MTLRPWELLALFSAALLLGLCLLANAGHGQELPTPTAYERLLGSRQVVDDARDMLGRYASDKGQCERYAQYLRQHGKSFAVRVLDAEGACVITVQE